MDASKVLNEVDGQGRIGAADHPFRGAWRSLMSNLMLQDASLDALGIKGENVIVAPITVEHPDAKIYESRR